MRLDQWQPVGLTLEPNAFTACTSQESVAVTAGPGAGKTELLAQRADFLLSTNICPYPRRILAISFKVDAAANLGQRVRERVSPDLARRLDSWTFHAFSLRLIRQFRPILTGIDALDPDFAVGDQRVERKAITFQDFVPLTGALLDQSNDVVDALRQTYSHVFLDEFQDCTSQQYALISRAFHGSDTVLTAVGDSKQRIMRWAGALEGAFGRFVEEFEATPLRLYQNFRSAPVLRRMQNRMIAAMEPTAAVDPSDLPGEGGSVEVMDATDSGEEARAVAEWVRRHIAAGTRETDIAILFSKQPNIYGETLFKALQEARIPYRDEQKLQDLAKEPLVQLILDYFQLLTGPRRPRAYLRLVRGVHFTSDDERAVYQRRTQWDAHLSMARTALAKHASGFADLVFLKGLVDGLLGMLGRATVVALHPDYESEERVNSIVDQSLYRISELIVPGLDPAESLDRFAEEDAVRVLTIHKAKGMEFDAVVVIGVEEETFWGDPEDERAAFFVAISRAKRDLLLTFARHRPRPQSAMRWNSSRRPHREFLSYVYEA